MKISIYGVGYVGLVTGVCLAKLGHEVCCYDIDASKIDALKKGQPTIYEAGLEVMLSELLQRRQLHFTADFNEVSRFGLAHIIAVGTPPMADGSADLSHVLDVANLLAKQLSDSCVVINKSTVPVGTADRVRAIFAEKIEVISNPEFLKEGKAIEDFMHPDRIIIGSSSERATEIMREIYAPLIEQDVPFVVMSPRSAELTKYAANAFLATKISFMNEMSQLAELLHADINEVKLGMGYDKRIGNQFLNAGCGYGGSCFPKDVAALNKIASDLQNEANILNAVQKTNAYQKTVLFKKMDQYFDGDLTGRRIAMWGLAFKPGTDDIRSAPSLTLIEQLWKAGAVVQAYDPMAMDNVRKHYGEHQGLSLCDSAEASLEGAHTLVILTEWPEFLDPNFVMIKAKLHQPIIFDGRNIFKPEAVAAAGLQYCGIGCGLPLTAKATAVEL